MMRLKVPSLRLELEVERWARPVSVAINGRKRIVCNALIIIIIKTLFSVGITISYKLLFLEAHLTKYLQTMKICKQNKARTHIQFVQIRH